jgi:hypothetical protein
MAKTKKITKKAVKKIVKKVVKKPVKKLVKKIVKKTTKKVILKDSCCEKCIEGKFIGKITHYFSNIEVAVIELVSPLKMGDSIRVVGGQETDFEQKVGSMQIDHKEVKVGKKGDSVGLKIDEKVHEGYNAYKV